MSSFDQSGVTGLIGLWEFDDGNKAADTGLDDGLAQDGTFEKGASATGGRAVFDGHNDYFDVEGDNGGELESAFDLDKGVIETQFTSDPNANLSNDTIVNRGEFKDMETEGWFGIRVTHDGKVIVQHCPIGPDGTRIDAFIDTPPGFFEAGETINVNYEWDFETGSTATITNVSTGEVFTETKDVVGLTMDIGDNDDEIFTFGAREVDDGKYDQHFDGSIDYVAVYESAVTADPDGIVDGEADGEEMLLDYDDSNAPTDGGGDLITEEADFILGNGGSDTIDGAGGDDTIYGDSLDTAPLDREIFEWGEAPGFANGVEADGFTQNTGNANITFSITNEEGDVENQYETTLQNTDDLDPEVATNESFESVLRDDEDTATYNWESDVPLENVEFRVNDIDGDGVVQIKAFDPDGNPIEVVLSDVGSDLEASDEDGVPGNDQVASTDNDYTPDSDGIHSVLVTIPGPVGSWEVIHSMSGDFDSGINFTDITFDIVEPDLGPPGDDVIDGGAGDDLMFGQEGNDEFIEVAGDGADTVSDFGADDTGSINDNNQDNNDFVDLSAFYNETTVDAVNNSDADPSNDFGNALGMLRADAADGRIDGVIDGVDYSDPNLIGDVDITLLDGDGNAVTGTDLTFDNTNVACFVRGTQIATRRGSVAIEDLQAGDEVITMDHGFQKIRWIGSTAVPATGALAPVVIRKGAMGNERDLRVSPQHRMLVRGWHVELMFDQKEALVPAKALINDETVFPLEGGTVEYFHMMFDRHELVYAEGIPSESFHPGHVGLGSFAEETREEILSLFPELRVDAGKYSEHVRPSLRFREAKVLAENPELMKE